MRASDLLYFTLLHFLLAIISKSPCAARARCSELTCDFDPHSLLHDHLTKKCHSCEDCTVDGYSVCITDSKPQHERRSRSSSYANENEAAKCICRTQVPEKCSLKKSKSSEKTTKFYATICYQFAHKPLPAPEGKISKSGLVALLSEFINEYEYWRSFNISSMLLHYEFPYLSGSKCPGKLKFPSAEELQRINKAENELENDKTNHMMCAVVLDLKNNTDQRILLEDEFGELESEEDDMPGDYVIDKKEFGNAEFAKLSFDAKFDQPRQIIAGKITNKKGHFDSGVVEKTLNWEQIEYTEDLLMDPNYESSDENPDSHLDNSGPADVDELGKHSKPVKFEVDDQSSQKESTKIAITTRVPTMSDDEANHPTEQAENTKKVIDFLSEHTHAEDHLKATSTTHEIHSHSDHTHHQHHHEHISDDDGPVTDDEHHQSSSKEATNNANEATEVIHINSTPAAGGEDDNLALYAFVGIVVFVLLIIALAAYFCRKRICGGTETNTHLNNGQTKNVDGKRYQKAPV